MQSDQFESLIGKLRDRERVRSDQRAALIGKLRDREKVRSDQRAALIGKLRDRERVQSDPHAAMIGKLRDHVSPRIDPPPASGTMRESTSTPWLSGKRMACLEKGLLNTPVSWFFKYKGFGPKVTA